MAAMFIFYKTPYNPCDTPLTYSLGSVDLRFGLQPSDVTEYAKEAAGIWNSEYGKPVLAYTAEPGKVTIYFVYDKRTELNNNVNEMQGRVSDDNATLQQQTDRYDRDVAAFEQKLNDLNARIQAYNSRGGAPADIYRGLIQEQSQLRDEGDALNARARQLNLATRDYNSEVRSLNQNVQELNQAMSQKPEQGLYDGMKKTITIYFAGSRQEFVHTLAHEFGHALGMDHVGDPQAIMYPYSTTSISLAPDDRKELAAICQSVPLPVHWAELLRDKLILLLQPATN